MDDKTKENRALHAVLTNPQKFPQDFYDWLRQNWHIFAAFEREANLVRSAGFEKWGHRTIWEYLRRETALRQKGGNYKLDNNYTKPCALLYLMLHPDAGNFFNFRNDVPVAEIARAA